jgi:hypothetical protein
LFCDKLQAYLLLLPLLKPVVPGASGMVGMDLVVGNGMVMAGICILSFDI